MNTKLLDPSNPPTGYDIAQNLRKRPEERVSYHKPGAFDYADPEVWARELWEQYVSFAALHERPTSKTGLKLSNTDSKRRQALTKLGKHLGHPPTVSDLKTAFPNLKELDQDIAKALDRDMKALQQI